RVLPRLNRVRGTVSTEPVPASRAGATPSADAISSLVLVADQAVPQGIALLDAPDVDSISED
ncbi:MAG TPA: ABC transporter, partial [Arthrobacter bacterium]|nr:ABC transporter [Arthrobacter sp.]